MDLSILGERLKELRDDYNYKQKKVSDDLGITIYQLSRYENGLSNPTPDLLNAFADYYDASVDYLLGRIHVKKITSDTYVHLTPTQKSILDFFENSPSLSFDETEAETLQKALEDLETYYEFLKFKAQKRPSDENH